MTTPTGFPAALRASARPRWSHRDPVEGDNPFEKDDPRYARWADATTVAREALRSHDDQLSRTVTVTADPERYRSQMLDLAVARFDTWARRGLSVISGDEACFDYAVWLHDFKEKWVAYAADTCPQIDARDQLRARLKARVARWTATAHAAKN